VQSLLGRSTPTERKEKRGICSPDFSFAAKKEEFAHLTSLLLN